MTRNGNDAEKRAARAIQRETGMPYAAALARALEGRTADECGHPDPHMDLECVCHCTRCADPRIERGEPGYCICPQCTVCRR